MDINSLNGANAYSNIPGSAPQVDNTQLREQNREAAGSDLESQNRATRAFEVSITQEARAKLAAQTTENTQQAQNEASGSANTRNTMPAHSASQIVNIVA
ncbi:MAG: hypothetical protein KKE62_10355 [Proteobacteria bacterium]|nr:hypothetical protein [Pseudomonadota bacterium]MBU1387852.1 hypothetical protein [Pseudomonadota bacterium]MBU1543229.1 hypothetical protein [Pseudomonadota bacterium]MBU2482462.1 hypothetical protein [Pseudomonadota bacterium]